MHLPKTDRTKEEFIEFLKQILITLDVKETSISGCPFCKSPMKHHRDAIEKISSDYLGLTRVNCFSFEEEFNRLYPDFSPEGFKSDKVKLGKDGSLTISFSILEDHIPTLKMLA